MRDYYSDVYRLQKRSGEVLKGVLKQIYDLLKESLDSQNAWLEAGKEENACNGPVIGQQLILIETKSAPLFLI